VKPHIFIADVVGRRVHGSSLHLGYAVRMREFFAQAAPAGREAEQSANERE
jgi:hypothetical protein